jgi:hypothetical protein
MDELHHTVCKPPHSSYTEKHYMNIPIRLSKTHSRPSSLACVYYVCHLILPDRNLRTLSVCHAAHRGALRTLSRRGISIDHARWWRVCHHIRVMPRLTTILPMPIRWGSIGVERRCVSTWRRIWPAERWISRRVGLWCWCVLGRFVR